MMLIHSHVTGPDEHPYGIHSHVIQDSCCRQAHVPPTHGGRTSGRAHTRGAAVGGCAQSLVDESKL